ncbi:MAG TPA: hypothetical protein PLN21_05920 [Gemmatales bacterium]|nr:hypothetical protein [Gemmatales bacterium]
MDSAMKELQQWDMMLRVIGLIVGIITAVILYRDASYLKENGARLSPVLWAILGLLLSVVAAAIYCALRTLVWNQQLGTKSLVNGDEGSTSTQVSREQRPETLAASPFPVNDSRYVRPTIYQLIGEMCLVCQKRIASTIEGRFCDICGCGVHNKCVKPQPPEIAGTNCSGCGGDPRTRIIAQQNV